MSRETAKAPRCSTGRGRNRDALGHLGCRRGYFSESVDSAGNFFTSEVNLQEWGAVHPDVDGEIMGLDEAFEYAKRMLQEHIH